MSVVAYTLKEKIPFAANEWKSIKLPRYPCITEIDLRIKLNVTGGSSPSAAPDAPYSVLKRILIAQGGKYPIQTDGYRLFVKNYYEYGGYLKLSPLPGAGTTSDVVFNLILHPGLYPERKDDDSIAIDASVETTELQVLWGSDADLGTDYTINSGEIEVTIWVKRNARPRYRPAWEITTKTIDRTYSDLGFEIDLPLGKLIPKVIIITRDSSGNRSDSIITEIGIVDKRVQRTEVHRISAEEQKYDDQRRYRVKPITGVYILDASEIGVGAFLGVRDVVIGLTTVATGSVDILFPAYLR